MFPGLNGLSLGAFLFPVDFSSPLVSRFASTRALWTQTTFFFRLLLVVFFSNDSNFFCCYSEHITSGMSSGESLSPLASPPMSRTDNLLCPVYIFVFQYKLVFSPKFGIHRQIVIYDTFGPPAVVTQSTCTIPVPKVLIERTDP